MGAASRAMSAGRKPPRHAPKGTIEGGQFIGRSSITHALIRQLLGGDRGHRPAPIPSVTRRAAGGTVVTRRRQHGRSAGVSLAEAAGRRRQGTATPPAASASPITTPTHDAMRRLILGKPSAAQTAMAAAVPPRPATPGSVRVRADLLNLNTNDERRAYLHGLGLNQTRMRAMARDLGVRGAGRSTHDQTVDAIVRYLDTGPAPAATSRRPRPGRDGLDAMNDRDLHDLAMEYGIPPVGLGTADRAALIGRLRAAGATAPRSGAPASRRPSVGLRISLLLNDWSAGNGPDDPLEIGFTREQLRQAARSRNISLPRGAGEDAIRQALYDSVRGPARQRRATTGSLVPVGDLFGRRMTDAERKRRLKEVFEGDFGGLTTVLDDAFLNAGYGVPTISTRGRVLDANGHQVGTFSRQYSQRRDGGLVAYHAYLQISGSVQGNGFSNAFNGHLINWYRRSGVESVSVHANIDVGGYTWASFGYDFADESEATAMADRFRRTLRSLETTGGYGGGRRPRGAGMRTADQIAALRTLLARVDNSRFGQPGYPTAYEFSQAGRWPGAGGRRDVWIGKALMLGTSWHGRLDLTSPSPPGP